MSQKIPRSILPMFTHDVMLRKSRTSVSDIIVMDYQGKRIHHDCLVDDSKNYLYLEENKDAENNNDANQLAYIASRKPNNTLCNGVLVHKNVCYINCNGSRYRVYACGKYGILPDDMRMDDIEKMVKTIGGVLMQWHKNNILHFDMNPQSILVNLQGDYAIWEYSHIRSVNTFKEHNPIIGSTIASATSGTTENHSDSGWSTPSARPLNATATAPPICTMKLQATAFAIRLGCCW